MKALKKAMAVLIAALMMFALALPAFADDSDQTDATNSTYTITAPAGNHIYEIYQIFTGTLHEETVNGKTTQVLSNVKWGKNSKSGNNTSTITVGDAVPETVLNEVKEVTGSDAQKLATIEKYVDLTSQPVPTITNGEIYTAEPGYYLIKDKDGSQQGKNDAYTTYIVTVVGNVTITPKTGVPSSEKKVKDNDNADNNPWQDSADYSIGDEVPFQLKATLPSNYDDYTFYKLVFHDKQSNGLNFKANTVEVMVDGTKISETQYNVNENGLTDGDTFEIEITNLKVAAPSATKDSVVTVEYKSKLNTNAVIGATGNPNEMYLEYSNNPNGEGTGKTPEDKVTVFTFKLVANKVAQNNEPLSGAEFKLEKKAGNDWVDAVTATKNTEGTEFTFIGLDAGVYRLTETTTPRGYNTIAPIEFTIEATHETNSADPKLTELKVTPDEKFTVDADNTITTTIVNQKGSELPGTGGIGTTIFYIVGGLLMAVAAVLLITKKRMSNK